MIIFDGLSAAAKKEELLGHQVAELLQAGKKITIAAILFREDAGSQLYTRLKREAAERVGMRYLAHEFSLLDPVSEIVMKIQELNQNSEVTGIIVQKPTKKMWAAVRDAPATHNGVGENQTFSEWWLSLVSAIDPQKDVDGLHPETMHAIAEGTWKEQGKVLPATCQAVLEILQAVPELQVQIQTIKNPLKIRIVGKSDLLGTPLFHVLRHAGSDVQLLTRADLEARRQTGQFLTDADVVVSATGVQSLITGQMVQQNVILIDVGEPRPDIDLQSIQEKAAFITPVPGGVGPMTVVCLLENAVKLVL